MVKNSKIDRVRVATAVAVALLLALFWWSIISILASEFVPL